MRLYHFFFDSRSTPSLGLIRITFGFILLVNYLWLATDFEFLFSPQGLVGAQFYSDHLNAPWVARPSKIPFLWLSRISSEGVIFVLYSLLLIASASFMVGFKSRSSGTVALILHVLFYSRQSFAFWGWGEMIKPYLLYILLSPGIYHWSLDQKRRSGDWSFVDPVSQWPVRLLQAHILTLYVTVAYSRLDNPMWLDGSAVHRILTHATFARFPGFDWSWLSGLGHASWLFELAAPLLLVHRRWAKWGVLGLILMHLGLEALTMVGWWNLMMVAALSIFLPQSWFESPPRWNWRGQPSPLRQ